MAHADQARAPANPGNNRARQQAGCDEPEPFPVIVVRPATVKLAPYTRGHRRRQRAANQMAAALTEACREGTPPRPGVDWGVAIDLDDPRDYLTGVRDLLRRIIDDGPVLAAAPPPGAVRIGRDNRGRAVVVVLHSAAWSLLLCPAQPHPRAWAFLGAYHGTALSIYPADDRLSMQWNDMLDTVFAVLTT